MKLSLPASALALIFYAAAAIPAPGSVINDAELRGKPKLDAKPGARVEAGTRIDILNTQGAWVEIETPEGQRGWLRLMNVRPGEKKHWSETVKASVGSVGAVVRTASTDSTATTGIRGISKEQLEQATPNFDEVKLLDRFQVSAAEARKFAVAAKIRPQEVAVLNQDDDKPKQ